MEKLVPPNGPWPPTHQRNWSSSKNCVFEIELFHNGKQLDMETQSYGKEFLILVFVTLVYILIVNPIRFCLTSNYGIMEISKLLNPGIYEI